MTTVNKLELTEATAPLAEYVENANQVPLVLLVKGKPVAALVPLENETDLETLMLSTDPDFLDLIEKARKRQKLEGGVSIEEARRRLGLAG